MDETPAERNDEASADRPGFDIYAKDAADIGTLTLKDALSGSIERQRELMAKITAARPDLGLAAYLARVPEPPVTTPEVFLPAEVRLLRRLIEQQQNSTRIQESMLTIQTADAEAAEERAKSDKTILLWTMWAAIVAAVVGIAALVLAIVE